MAFGLLPCWGPRPQGKGEGIGHMELLVCKLALYVKGEERPKKEADRSGLVNGRFNN